MSTRRFLGLLVLAVVALNLLIAVITWVSLARSRQRYQAQAAVNAQNLALVLEQNITGTISRIDVGVWALTRELERQLAAGGIDRARLEDYLQAEQRTLPEVDGLRYADPGGRLFYGPGGRSGPAIQVEDRDYFTGLREHPEWGLVVTRPMKGRIIGRWVVILARRVNGPGGAFAGVAFAALPLEAIDRLFSSLKVGQYGAFALRHGEDLSLYARYPEPEGIGSAVGHRKMSEEFLVLRGRGQRTGSYDAPSGLDRRMRTWGFLKSGDDRFYLFVGLARDEYLAPWRREAGLTGLFLGSFALVTAIGGLGLFHSWRRDRRMEEERRRLELQLQAAQKLESLGSLAGGVAHDMNNVLGAILSLASANRETQPAGSAGHRAFDTIATAAVRGGTMVKALLSLARQSPAEVRELDLNALVREEAQLLEHTTLSRIRLAMDLATGLRPMRGDPGALAHAIMNLFVNAADAMADGGTLALSTRNLDPDRIELVVQDSGCGMPEHVLERAMEPFFTTKAQGKGTGLGLSIVYSTVKAHQGDVEIQSEPGRGTRVSLRFRACEPAGAADLQPAAGPFPARTGLAVLLVDDDELIQISTEAALEVLGHATLVAATGEEALARLEGGLRPDAVILDLNMPGLGGAATLPRLRGLLPDVPVLLATGRADQTALDLVAAYPDVTLLPKPYSVEDLRERFRQIGLA